jgi:hypothetical protein
LASQRFPQWPGKEKGLAMGARPFKVVGENARGFVPSGNPRVRYRTYDRKLTKSRKL